jgi:hypothetical protein
VAVGNTLAYYDTATITAVKSFMAKVLGKKRLAVANTPVYNNVEMNTKVKSFIARVQGILIGLTVVGQVL